MTDSHIKVLLKNKPFIIDDESDNQFNKALYDEIIFHRKNNNLYKKYLIKKKFSINKNISNSFYDLPYVPVQIFKELGGVLSSVEQKDIKNSLQSSATSGKPSKILVDKETSRRQIKAMVKVLGDFIGNNRRKFHIMDASPTISQNLEISARMAAARGFLNFSAGADYYLNVINNNLSFDLKRFEDTLDKQPENEPLIIFGFTYVLYFDVIKKLVESGKSFKLPKDSKVLHIGGWKKLESKKIGKIQFNREISNVFGISPVDVIDIYGFTEQMGLIYPDCEFGFKHTSNFSRLIVRDPVSHEILNDGEVGILQFISPIPHSYPGNSILTDDLGLITSREQCKCGRHGISFKITGRAKKAEVRGCGDVMAVKLVNENKQVDIKRSRSITINYYQGLSKYNNKSFKSTEVLVDIFSDLKKSKDWLAKQDVDNLIQLISLAREKWMEDDFILKNYKKRGLDFLISWTEPSNLKSLVDFSLNGQRGYLDSFRPANDSVRRLLKANPKGIIGHWLSGNVPILGLLTIVQGIITKNVNVLKVASSYSDIIPQLLKSFEDIQIKSYNSQIIYGKDLLKTIAVVYFDKNNIDAGTYISKHCDVRLVWGGNDAVQAISSLPRKIMADDIIFGPKLSFMAIGRHSFASKRLIRKIVRKAATDVSVFDQTACASPHTIFVETGGEITPKDFAEKLAIEMESTLKRIPVGDFDSDRDHLVSSKRALYEFIGEVWSSSGSEWTVLFDESFELADPVYNRTITIRPVKNIMDVSAFASNDIQTIGLSLDKKRRLKFAEIVTSKGVERCPDIGLMTHFENPWDGQFVINKMVRWSTLGGP